MFSAEDAKQIFELLALDGDSECPLMLEPNGHGFVTRKYTCVAIKNIVNDDPNERTPVSSLARDLNVSADAVSNIAKGEGMLVVRGEVGLEILSKAKKDVIDCDIEEGLMNGLVSKEELARRYQLRHSGIDALLEASELQILEVNGYIYSKSYDAMASESVARLLRDNIKQLQPITLRSTDVPGNPPLWYIQRTINSLLEESEFSGQLHIRELASGVECTPMQMMQQMHDSTIDGLQSGKIAYIDINAFQRDHAAILSSLQEARTSLEGTKGIKLEGSYAISEAWISNFSKSCLESMAEDGDVDFGQPVIANFPDSIYAVILEKVEQTIRTLSPSIHRAGESLLSEDSYSRHRGILLDLAKADAASQWHRIKESPRTDARFSLSSTFYQLLEDNPILQNLVKERALERAIDDAFSAKISELEKKNEVEFADFWTDRVCTRLAIYSEGLTRVEDQKLQDQLSDLLAQYIQNDLIPDAISKAASQGLLLSRRARKNVQRLESALDSHSMDVAALASSLEKFNKKQFIDTPSDSTLQSSKSTMLGDMARRMQKQKRSDGPLLFLTLVVFLFAKHNTGVVYATGKYAPKLLRQLKPVLDAEQYSQLEAWKESARAGSLSADDRNGMKKMVEAGV